MSTSGTQTPLGINVFGSLLQNIGLNINPVAQGYMGASKTNSDYTPGSIVNDTVLKNLTLSINLAYNNTSITTSTYNALISIGADTIPALGNAKAPTYVISDPSGNWSGEATTGYSIIGNTDQGQQATWLPYDKSNPNNSVTQWGFIRLFALQAWNEFNWNGIPNGPGMPQYKDTTESIMIAKSYIANSNTSIFAAQSSTTFMQGTFSTMNDLMSGEVTSVTLATPAFGQDCITAGRAIDLSKIGRFGMPSSLLQTIKTNNALTNSLALALLSAGLTNQEIDSITKGAGTTKKQEQQIYGAFLIIVGQDLYNILVPLNCKTQGLNSLADLLNVKMIFPNSYQSLTVPLYNITPSATNSKTFYTIYTGNSINSSIDSPAAKAQIGTITPPGPPVIVDTTTSLQVPPTGFSSYLTGILPNDIAVAAGAFGYSMQQIKNIQQVNFEKFAQVVASIEITKGLSNLSGTSSPVDSSLADQVSASIALGSGPNGTYTYSDFFGCMSGLPYMWNAIQSDILSLQTPALGTIYLNMYQALTSTDPIVISTIDTIIQSLVAQANIEIASIKAANLSLADTLNTLYNVAGTQLKIEQRARFIGIAPVPAPIRNTRLSSSPTAFTTFVNAVPAMGLSTEPHMAAQVLEAISDVSTTGGQSLIGMMRTSRNQSRLTLIGVPLDNEIPGQLDLTSTKTLISNGTLDNAVDGVNGYTIPSNLILPPQVAPDPAGYFNTVANAYFSAKPASPINQISPLTDILGTTENCACVGDSVKAGPRQATVVGTQVDIGQGYPGSLGGSSYTNLVPPNLNGNYISATVSPSTYTVAEAIAAVESANNPSLAV